MDSNSLRNLKRLEEQIFSYKRNIKSTERKSYVSNRLRQQLLESEAVVKIKRMDAECEDLMISLKQRVMLLQDCLIPNNNNVVGDEDKELNLSFDSCDDETLSSSVAKKRTEKQKLKIPQKKKLDAKEVEQDEKLDTSGLHLPLALRREQRERKLSYKSYSSTSASTSTSHSKRNHLKLQKEQHALTFHSEEMVIEQDKTPTLHIKIPSLHRGNVHYIVVDSLKFARKAFDFRANEIKEQQQPKTPRRSKILKAHKSQLNHLSCSNVQQEQDMELSQLIQDVMAEACADETLHATSALENINKNLVDNYDPIPNDDSKSLEELPCCSNENNNMPKKSRKYTKRTNEQKPNEPPRKRGRKPKIRDVFENPHLESQPPTKSNLAKYVELFSNDCELLPGSSTPAASSTRSQPLVSSTTHNYDVFDQLPQQDSSSQPITYYIDGDWANGGMCQLVPTSTICVDSSQQNQHDINDPVQDFVNYVDNKDNDVIGRNLECNKSFPISIPLSIANLRVQSKNKNQASLDEVQQQSTIQTSGVPIINIQIPTLPDNIIVPSAPPPAHTHKSVLDLSFNSKSNNNVLSTQANNSNQNSKNNFETLQFSENYDCLPLDLSAKSGYVREMRSENHCITIDTQDEDFIRRLIEQNEFDYSSAELERDENLAYNNAVNNKSFKAALDMPLLDFDTTEFAQLVEQSTTIRNEEQTSLTDENIYNDSTNNEESNYVSMTAINISDQSELFNKLLDICPENQFLPVMNSEFGANDNLNDTVFDQGRVENSTMYEVEHPTAKKKKLVESKTTFEKKIFKNETASSTCLAVHLNSSCTLTDMSIDILGLKASDDDSNVKDAQVINLKDSLILSVANNEMDFKTTERCKSGQNSNEMDKVGADINEKSLLNVSKKAKQNFIEYEDSKLTLKTNKRDEDVEGNKEKNYKEENAIDSITNKNVTLLHEERGLSLNSVKLIQKPTENIVFSVTKITLSEDENLYTTDSDASSNGKSNELCEHNTNKLTFMKKQVSHPGNQNGNFIPIVEHNVKKQAISDQTRNANEIFKKELNLNSSFEKDCESNTKLLYICKNGEMELQNEHMDCINNLENTKVTTSKKEFKELKDSNVTEEQHYTLLELESKLDGSLDFDDEFDDALSLATSCFNSPIDDRFDDPVTNINATITIKAPQNINGSNPCTEQIKEFKNFKIPKICNVAEPSSFTVANKPETIDVNNSIQTKVTSSVKNDLVQSNTSVDNITAEQVLENERTLLENIILKVFGVTCLPYLVDKCYTITQCKLSHEINDTKKVYQNLHSLNKIELNLAYRVLYNHLKLFKVYFKFFCDYYTNKNDRLKILNMVNDCERYPECAEFLIIIYEALVKCGLGRVNACRLLLKRIHGKSIATSIIEALVTIIMKSDWTMFTDFIEKFTQDIYKYNFRINTLEQMAPDVLNSKASHLKQVFGKCVQTLHCDDMSLLLNSPLLIQCVALLTTSTQ